MGKPRQREYPIDGIRGKPAQQTLDDLRRSERDSGRDDELPPEAGPRRLRNADAEPERHDLARRADPPSED